jgi:hypothetical protein
MEEVCAPTAVPASPRNRVSAWTQDPEGLAVAQSITEHGLLPLLRAVQRALEDERDFLRSPPMRSTD